MYGSRLTLLSDLLKDFRQLNRPISRRQRCYRAASPGPGGGPSTVTSSSGTLCPEAPESFLLTILSKANNAQTPPKNKSSGVKKGWILGTDRPKIKLSTISSDNSLTLQEHLLPHIKKKEVIFTAQDCKIRHTRCKRPKSTGTRQEVHRERRIPFP